jgi:hypothetical protein
MVFRDWFRDRLPARPTHLPADVTEPGPEQRQTALRLAIAVAAPAVLSLLPVVLSGHANLLAAPPWALWAVLLAVVQLIYAGWMVNAPDWASARVQMIVCAAATTIYAMAMTLVLITPVNRPLILGLGEARRLAPGWCGVMFLLLGVATWYCGRTSARWRNKVPSPSGRGLG